MENLALGWLYNLFEDCRPGALYCVMYGLIIWFALSLIFAFCWWRFMSVANPKEKE